MSPSSLNSMNVSATCHFDVVKCYSVTAPIKPLTDRCLQMSHLLKMKKDNVRKRDIPRSSSHAGSRRLSHCNTLNRQNPKSRSSRRVFAQASFLYAAADASVARWNAIMASLECIACARNGVASAVRRSRPVEELAHLLRLSCEPH